MSNNYIDCFIESCTSVMESFGMPVKTGDAVVRKSPYPADATIVVIGITGDLHGQAMVSLDESTVCHIASVMMGGAPVEMNEGTKSAVSELSNMIVGNAATLLSQQDIMIDITPPSVLTGDNIFVSTNSLSVSVQFFVGDGKMLEFSLSAKEI